MIILILSMLLLSSCEQSVNPTQTITETIKGRDTKGPRQAIYRAKIPNSWIRHDLLPDDSVIDTRKPLVEFLIVDADLAPTSNPLRIVVHNFPSESAEERIPPQAQINRWQQQFDSLSSTHLAVEPQSFNGYVGLQLTVVGTQKDEQVMVLGWALKLADPHYRNLSSTRKELFPSERLLQMKGDVTIKATGPYAAMEKYRDEITAFARSFELIDDLPER